MGDHLFRAIYPLYSDLVAILTRALLEQSYNELFPLLSSQSKLASKLLTITAVLPSFRQNQTRQLARAHLESVAPVISQVLAAVDEAQVGICIATL